MTEAVPSQVSRRALMRGLGLLTLASGTMSPVRAAARLRVVASFSILYDMVRQVGGGRVDVTALVGPDSDAHVFNPTPADVRAVASADIFLVNGLSFEGWLGRLEQASRTRARVVHATQGVKRRLIRGTHDGHADDHGDGHAHDHDHSPRPGGEAVDPHAWQSLVNGQVYVRNIEAALAATDRANAPYFAERARTYRAELETLHAQARARLARVPPQYRRIVTNHDAFGYFGDAYGLNFIAPAGVSTGGEPNAADIARLIEQIRREKIRAIFIENISDARLLQQIAQETGVRIGGRVFSDALSDADGPAPTYIKMFHHNLDAFALALSS